MKLAGILAALVLTLPLAAAAPLLVPQQGDPDLPAVTAPVASVQVFLDERFSFTEGYRTRSMSVPDVEYDRVVLTFQSRPQGDPWDRLTGVAIGGVACPAAEPSDTRLAGNAATCTGVSGGVEVLKATTPRADFTLTKDITEYASLLPRGGAQDVSLFLGTWVGAILASVRIDFYVDEPTAALVAPPADAVVAAQRWAYVGGTGSESHTIAHFPAVAAATAHVEVRTSGHGADGEFWYLNAASAHPVFHVLVDGAEVGLIVPPPYTYALVGFGTGSVVADTVVNPGMWWTQQRAADVAGVHTGVGEIPAYRAEVDAALLPLLTGDRDVAFVVESGGGTWVTSVDLLLNPA
ncbi:MAG TPA: hypothetical protein VM370_05845 [Candidatus Thermoplasmatota archaeon]|nr:hypothetical protein [Candidatus Thermoplasmatota archaeon]